MIRAIRTNDREYAHDPARRGYHAVYREQQTNYCPGCGRTHWWLGRFSAECCFCATALPFADVQLGGSPLHVRCSAATGPIETI